MAVTATVRTTDTFDAGPLNTTKWIARAPSSGSGGGVTFDTSGSVNLKSSTSGSYSGAGATWLSENITPSTSNADVELRARWQVGASDGTFRMYARSSISGDGNRYEIMFNPGNAAIEVQRVAVSGAGGFEVANPSFSMGVGTWVNVVFAVWTENGTTNIGAKWWADGGSEPANYMAQGTDPGTPLASGYHGAVGYPGGSTVSRSWQVDYLTVSALTQGVDRTFAVTDGVGVSDNIAAIRQGGIEELVGLSDSFDRQGDFIREVTDGAGLSDTLLTEATVVLTIDDTLALADDDFTASAIRTISVDDGAGLADERDGWGFQPNQTDPASPTEGPIVVAGEFDPDSVGLAEDVLVQGDYVRAFDEQVGPAEDAFLAREIPVDEQVPVVESFDTLTAYQRAADDTLALSDEATAGVEYTRSFDDGPGPADTFSTAVGNITYWDADADDTLGIGDGGAELVTAWTVRVDEQVGPVDVFSGQGDQDRRFDDYLALTDEVFFRRDWALEFTDTPCAGDTAGFQILAPVEWTRTIVETYALRETLAFTGRRPNGRGTAVLAPQRLGAATLGSQQVAVASLSS